jgi:hypothetical protein
MKTATNTGHKTTLLLDLDETTFIALTEAEFAAHGASQESTKAFKRIHESHTLSSYVKNSGFYFFVLNPERLKAMIEAVYKQGDDIVIFTAGLWLPPILAIVSELCNLEADSATKFQSSLFLNPQHDGEKLGYSAEATRTLLKGYRLHGLFRSMDSLRSRHFILLDNDAAHISSCAESSYITGVKATTDIDDKSFYDTVLKEMQSAHSPDASLSPSVNAYYFTSAILKAFMQLEKESVDPLSPSA